MITQPEVVLISFLLTMTEMFQDRLQFIPCALGGRCSELFIDSYVRNFQLI